jgi:iron(III) transport system substrate-binding protein
MWLRIAALAVVVLVGMACAPAAAPSPSASAAPPAGPSAGPDRAAAEWEEILAAARREGRVNVIGPGSSGLPDVLPNEFMKAYPDIRVDYNGMLGPHIPPKILNERAAGQYLTDLVIHGTSTILKGLMAGNALDPIRPYLVGPDVRDPNQWLGGRYDFADNEQQYDFVFGAYVKIAFGYNPSLVNPDEIKSWKDLLDPKWKGKMAMQSPLAAGPGQSTASYWYTNPDLGPSYVERMIKEQGLVFSRDDRQIADWVARGQYPIGFGIGDNSLLGFWERGLNIRPMPGSWLREQPYVTAGVSSLAVLNQPPHPNALKVYLNWLLGPEGQLAFSKSTGFASYRRDVPRDHVHEFLILKEGVEYDHTHKESAQWREEETLTFLKGLVPQ